MGGFIFAASRQPSLTPAVLIAGAAGLLGFSLINLSGEMASLASPGDLTVFWVELGLLAAYLAWLAAWFVFAKRESGT